MRTKGLYVGEKRKRGRAKKAEKRARVCEATRSVFVRKNRKSTSNLSFHLSLFDIRAFVWASGMVCFFPLFRLLYIKACVSNEISSFLKHRIHPKHGSGRTSSLTRSNTRKRVVVVLFLLLCLLRVALPSLISRFLFSSLPCGVCIKKKKSQWRSSSRREREKCASVFCVITLNAEVLLKRRSRTQRSRDRSTKPHKRIHTERVAGDEGRFSASQSGWLREERVRAIDFYLRTEAVKAKAPPLWEEQKKRQKSPSFRSNAYTYTSR